jgi:hypothetical protein
MTQHEDDLFTQALREDLPESADAARLRARLVSAGVLAGAVVAPGAAVGAAAGAGGLSAKLVALPLALKVGASLALAGAVAVPVVSRLSDTQQAETRGVLAARQVATARPAPRVDDPVKLEAPSNGEPAAAEPEPAATAPEPVVVTRAAAPAPPVREVTGTAPAARTLPSVASFTEPAGPVDEGSLRQETALMERALAALRRGDVTSARQALAEHASRFPNGHLVRERERALERTLGKETEHDSK